MDTADRESFVFVLYEGWVWNPENGHSVVRWDNVVSTPVQQTTSCVPQVTPTSHVTPPPWHLDPGDHNILSLDQGLDTSVFVVLWQLSFLVFNRQVEATKIVQLRST